MVTDGKQDCPLSFYFLNIRILLIKWQETVLKRTLALNYSAVMLLDPKGARREHSSSERSEASRQEEWNFRKRRDSSGLKPFRMTENFNISSLLGQPPVVCISFL